jgi:SAM-dependent methyltransferase
MRAPEDQDQWLDVGAWEKARSVEMLAAGMHPASVLEVGCGTGSVLARLVEASLAGEYAGCEPSRPLCEVAQSRVYGAPVQVECATFESSSFSRRSFDLIVITHVLEHVVDPARLLTDCLKHGRHVLVEVPLEGSLSGELRARLRRLVTGKSRMTNSAGHIQFFSARDLDHLARWCGSEIVASRTYYPSRTYQFCTRRSGLLRRAYYRSLLAIHRLTGDRFMASFHYGHRAVLLHKVSLEQLADAGHPLYWSPASHQESG